MNPVQNLHHVAQPKNPPLTTPKIHRPKTLMKSMLAWKFLQNVAFDEGLLELVFGHIQATTGLEVLRKLWETGLLIKGRISYFLFSNVIATSQVVERQIV